MKNYSSFGSCPAAIFGSVLISYYFLPVYNVDISICLYNIIHEITGLKYTVAYNNLSYVLSWTYLFSFFIESSILCHIDSPQCLAQLTLKGWHSQVCPRAIGGINTCHKMRHSLSLPTVTYILNLYVCLFSCKGYTICGTYSV